MGSWETTLEASERGSKIIACVALQVGMFEFELHSTLRKTCLSLCLGRAAQVLAQTFPLKKK